MGLADDVLTESDELDMSDAIQGSNVEYVGNYTYASRDGKVKIKKGDRGKVESISGSSVHIKMENGERISTEPPAKRIDWKLLPGPHYERKEFHVLLSTKSGSNAGYEQFDTWDEAVGFARRQVEAHGWKARISNDKDKLVVYIKDVSGTATVDKQMSRGYDQKHLRGLD